MHFEFKLIMLKYNAVVLCGIRHALALWNVESSLQDLFNKFSTDQQHDNYNIITHRARHYKTRQKHKITK